MHNILYRPIESYWNTYSHTLVWSNLKLEMADAHVLKLMHCTLKNESQMKVEFSVISYNKGELLL